MADTAPTPEPDAPDADPTPEAPAPDTEAAEVDWQKEAEKWKANARKHEERAKANAKAQKELDDIRQQSMSDIEKAADIARKEGRNEGLRVGASKVVAAEVRAAVAGRGIDADALLDGTDVSRFIDDDGEVDSDAVAAWVDRIAPKREDEPFDLGQGARGSQVASDDPLVRDLTNLARGR